MTNQELYNEKRRDYIEGTLTHAEFYRWVAEFIGVSVQNLPASWTANWSNLAFWDRQHPFVCHKAFAKGLAWSLSDTVCTMKQVALDSQ